MARKPKNVAVERIDAEAQDVYRRIGRKKKPQMKMSVRSPSNVRYRPRAGYFQLLGKQKVPTLTVGTVRTFAQTLKMLAMSKELIASGRNSTKREAYYQAYNWGEAAFGGQPESDALKNDPFIRHHKPWQDAIHRMLEMGVRVEQQSLAKHGLEFVARTYLPRKLKQIDKFLP